MPERRMFTQKITDSDAFTEMPLSTQALYFHLNMNADDDGFVNNPKKIARSIGASEDDLKLLLVKRFILGFDSGVIVIKHWRMHNLLRKDRYNPTQYQDEFKSLKLKENGSYTEDGNQMATNWQPDGNQLATQVRLGKDKLILNNNMIIQDDQNSVNTVADNTKKQKITYPADFEELWQLYPRRIGKDKALKAFLRAKKDGADKDSIKKGIEAYRAYIASEGIEQQYIKQGGTWFSQKSWEDEYTPSKKSGSFYSFEEHKHTSESDAELEKALLRRNKWKDS